ncbi:basic-leucine zipper transcription factor A-like isoform X2 [Condylostylus longicornis]|nr:basic-leucine zipper transcription factor A-like isoform X2 [Condylostylus longicornis]XP_055377225.1 basic-leucine zipper transcription factor A-like isoform X2 [Condylostylus longicornis]
MNFSPFAATQFAGLTANAVNQFATSKFAHNLTGANGQIVGVVSGGDGGVSYLRPIDTNNSSPFSPSSNHHLSPHQNHQTHQQQQQQSMNESPLHQQQHHQQQSESQSQVQQQALITLPITMPGAKPGDAAQTVHIQVINPNPIPQPAPTTKIHMGQMQIPIQSFQPGGTTVLTVAYSPQDGKFLPNHGFPEGMTVVAALQPQDLQILAQAQAQANAQLLNNQQHQLTNGNQQNSNQQQQNQETAINLNGDLGRDLNDDEIIVKQEPTDWDNTTVALTNTTQPDLSEFITTHSQAPSLPMTLTPFLKFNPNSIKYETPDFTIEKFDTEQLLNSGLEPPSPIQNVSSLLSPTEQNNSSIDEGSGSGNVTTTNGTPIKQKRKRRVKKPKVVKPKPPKPGQVLIATTTDGTVLFCCPECQMAYPEKENLEQHLTEHKIERRYICDICGAGLKRKEHLERHKSGHNPERPYICSVCMKGFKRKEHLNLHFVIHSGEKNEICGECGKGFYRKDHLRKHTNSHIAKRLKEEMNAREGITPTTPKNKKNKNNINNNVNLLDGSSSIGCANNNNNNNNNSINNNNINSNNNNINNNNNEIHSPLAGNDNNNILMQTSIQIGDSINPQQMQLDPIQITSNINNLNNNNKSSNNNNNNSDNNNLNTDNNNAINISINQNCGNTQTTQPAIALSTVYVPTSNNTTLPVQIQIPQIITTSKPDGTTESTIVMPTTTTESQNSTTIMSTS